jgi:class 3 adenylate cyclase/DNA-binding winged helix-turn-helix (wHTH) protein/tetratricopeptide (TPR) repeat protein
MRYVFGPYTLDLTRYELRQAGRLVRLEPRVFDLLAYFVQHPGRTVTTAELLEQLYPHQFAPVDRLTNAVTQARKALGDTGQTQLYIQTVRRRGYRFIAPVAVQPEAETDAPRRPLPDPPLPVEGLGQGHTDVGAPPTSAQSVLPAAPRPTPSTEPTPRTAGRDRPDAERRQLTVLVCRLISAPPRSAPLDPEVVLEVVQDYQAMCAEIVHQFAGHMAQEQGDQLVVYFGYPRAHEDDARRAVHTGLGIVERMVELNRRRTRDRSVRLAVRVGIHTGVVVVGAMGHAERGQLALGDTPTIAAQLQALAPPDMVVISSATLRLVEGYFDAQALGTHILEEAAEPLVVYQVLQESTAPSRFAVTLTKGLTPLVGREQEVGLLRERWEQVKDGLGQVVLLSGEAGIGKSRLVQAFTENLAGEAHTRIACHGSPYYQQSAFYPLIAQMQQRLRLSRDDPLQERLRMLEEALALYGFALEEVVPLFAALLSLPLPEHYSSLPLTPERQKQKTLEALLAWLLKEAERQPVCFIMEDLHWVDPSTLEFLSLLIEQVPMTSMLLLLVFRPDFRPPWALRSYLTSVALGRLSRRQVETMAERITGGKALPDEVLWHVVAKTDGVPLFVEELTKMILESGLVKEWEGQYMLTAPLPVLAIPATLHDSLIARLDQWEAAKPVAQLGAVVGREFAYDVLQAVWSVEEETLQQGLAQLVNAELLYQRGLLPQARYVFKHALIRDAAYQSLLKSKRQQYHRQIAQVLEARFSEIRETHPELLAHHYTEANLREEAIVYWQKASQRAIERSANLEAVGHLTKGLELLKTLPETPERIQQELMLQLALGPQLLMIKDHAAEEVEQTFTRAYELCQHVEGQQHFSALVGLWRFYSARARLQTAHELAERCFALAGRLQDAVLLQEAHVMMGSTLCHLGELVLARAHLEQGIALYDRQRSRLHTFSSGNDSGVTCLSWAAWTLWYLGYADRALTRAHEALTLAEALSHPYSLGFALFYAAVLHKRRRDPQLVHKRAEALVALANERGFVRWHAGGLILRGWALAEQGAEEEGIAQIHQGLAMWRAHGGELGLWFFLGILAEVYGKRGQVEEGLRVLEEALAIVRRNEEPRYESELYHLKGELLLRLAAGRTSAFTLSREAEVCFQRALDVGCRQQAKFLELRAAMSLARLWQKQGKSTESRQMLTRIYGWFTEGFDTPDLQEAKALLADLACSGGKPPC